LIHLGAGIGINSFRGAMQFLLAMRKNARRIQFTQWQLPRCGR
jgi:hypothetical protein